MCKVQSAREDKGVVVVECWVSRGHNATRMGVGKFSPLLMGFSRLVVVISNEDVHCTEVNDSC